MKKWLLFSVLFLGVVALGGSPAIAQIAGGSQGVELHLGAITGDGLTETGISGKTTESGDVFAIGVGYTFSPNDAEETPTGNIDLDLHLLDLNVLYYADPRDPVVAYWSFGVDGAFANLDENIVGTANGQPASIEESNGFTFNSGVGARYFTPIEHLFLLADARYRFISDLVDALDNELNTAEVIAGIGYRF